MISLTIESWKIYQVKINTKNFIESVYSNFVNYIFLIIVYFLIFLSLNINIFLDLY